MGKLNLTSTNLKKKKEKKDDKVLIAENNLPA